MTTQHRRALLIGISGFLSEDQEVLGDLHFAHDAIAGLAAVLREDFGFSVSQVTQRSMTAAHLGRLVKETLESADADTVLLVHLLTHGEARDQALYALGSDAVPHESTEIGGWLTGLQHVENRPTVLFTLDLCSSGTVTQLPWQSRYDRTGRKGWVIAACEPDQDAFNGHFTTALTTVLRDIAEHRLAVAPHLPYIPLGTVADAVRRTVVTLADAHRVYRQYVTVSRVEVSAEHVVLPLFLNPSHTGEEPRPDKTRTSASSRTAVAPPALEALIDEVGNGQDLRHFVDSATGLGGWHGSAQSAGGFTGRAHELRRISRWLDGEDPSPIALVTGSPGAGKSALLGVLVCAAHPRLHQLTRRIWATAVAAPAPVPHLVVIHARDRSLTAITSSLGVQLALGALGPEELQATLQKLRLPQPPTVVLDALDEAADIRATIAWLTRLMALKRPDGSAAVRLLIATRAYEETAVLHARASSAGCCFDLDAVAPAVLLADLHAYVSGLLRAVPALRGRHQMSGAFAGALAETLVAHRGSGWGEFLVAGLYTRHFTALFDPHLGNDAAEQWGRDAPRTLSQVLELHLAGPTAHPWLQLVLTALAHAHGEGMPASVIQRAVAALAPATAPSLADVQDALTTGYTFLCRSIDRDNVPVYRLFHRELTRCLRREEQSTPVLRSLLDGLGPVGRRHWSAAEPYVLRHVLTHADDCGAAADVVGDPGYLLYADPRDYGPFLEGPVRHVVSRWLTAPHSLDRRMALALSAVEQNEPGIAHQVATLPGEPPLPWLPLWAAGRETSSSATGAPAVAVLTARGDLQSWNWEPPEAEALTTATPRALAFARSDGRSVLIIGTSQGQIAVADRKGRTVTWATHGNAVTALAATHQAGGSLVISATSAGEVTAYDLQSGTQVGPVVTVPDAPPTTLAAVGHGTLTAVVCTSGGGRLWSWFCGGPDAPSLRQWATESPVCSLAVGHSAGRLVLLAGQADGTTIVWDMQSHTRKRVLPTNRAAVNAIALGRMGDLCVAVIGSQDGTLAVWDLSTFRRVGEPIRVDGDPIRAVALHHSSDGDLCCLVCGDSTTLWNLNQRTRLQDFGQQGVHHAVLTSQEDQPAPAPSAAVPKVTGVGTLAVEQGPTGKANIALYADDEGTCYAVNPLTGRQVCEPLPGDGAPVTGIESVALGGVAVALLRSPRRCRLWDPSSGAHATRIPWEEPNQRPADLRLSSSFVGDTLITVHAGTDGHLRIGDVITADGHQGAVTIVVATRLSGRAVALSGGTDGVLRVWDLESSRCVDEIEFDQPIFAVVPNGEGIVLVGAGERVYALQHLSTRPDGRRTLRSPRPAPHSADNSSPCADPLGEC
ncbi:hypothetical protein ACFY9S_20065 [Streptomyces sp. NPDC012474]|uniref:hypothetical protein n=1 Tax=Streptomyces sp. NPDC012474 TaxID=3364836 RepID=UPI0036EA453C